MLKTNFCKSLSAFLFGLFVFTSTAQAEIDFDKINTLIEEILVDSLKNSSLFKSISLIIDKDVTDIESENVDSLKIKLTSKGETKTENKAFGVTHFKALVTGKAQKVMIEGKKNIQIQYKASATLDTNTIGMIHHISEKYSSCGKTKSNYSKVINKVLCKFINRIKSHQSLDLIRDELIKLRNEWEVNTVQFIFKYAKNTINSPVSQDSFTDSEWRILQDLNENRNPVGNESAVRASIDRFVTVMKTEIKKLKKDLDAEFDSDSFDDPFIDLSEINELENAVLSQQALNEFSIEDSTDPENGSPGYLITVASPIQNDDLRMENLKFAFYENKIFSEININVNYKPNKFKERQRLLSSLLKNNINGESLYDLKHVINNMALGFIEKLLQLN